MAVKCLLRSSLFVPLLVVCQARVEAACQRVEEYNHLEGFCYVKGRDSCDGTEFRRGCAGPDCALCVQNTRICLENSVCSDANGVCVRNLIDCDKLINERHCHGDGCACCKDGCERQEKCRELDGFCLLKGQRHLCKGTQFNLGCLGTDCFCCVPDTSKCIEKLGCLKANGNCLKEADWPSCPKDVDSFFCIGDGCACCRETGCVRRAACADAGGYCFRKKQDASQQHVCNGQQSADDCGSSNCACCIPS